MDIIKYSKQHNKFRQKVRDFVNKEIIPCVDQWEKDKMWPRSVWKRCGEEGFLCSGISEKYGGQSLDYLYGLIVTEEFTKARQCGAGPALHSNIVVPYVESYATEENKKKYLPGCISGDIITAVAMTEPDTGSDLASISTTAVETGDEVIINGSKIFISNGISSDLIILAAKDPAVKNPHKAISLYLVEADTTGFSKGRNLGKLGMRSNDTAELFFSNCKIPIQNRLGNKGEGFKLLMSKLQAERLITALWAMVSAEYIYDNTLAFYKNNYGPKKTYLKSQAVEFALVEVVTEIKIARTFMDTLIVDHMEGKNIVTEISMAKYWISELAKKVGNKCLDIFGDQAILESCPIVRTCRDVKAQSIFAGTTEIMKVIIGKSMQL